jgi:hypothetical protein
MPPRSAALTGGPARLPASHRGQWDAPAAGGRAWRRASSHTPWNARPSSTAAAAPRHGRPRRFGGRTTARCCAAGCLQWSCDPHGVTRAPHCTARGSWEPQLRRSARRRPYFVAPRPHRQSLRGRVRSRILFEYLSSQRAKRSRCLICVARNGAPPGSTLCSADRCSRLWRLLGRAAAAGAQRGTPWRGARARATATWRSLGTAQGGRRLPRSLRTPAVRRRADPRALSARPSGPIPSPPSPSAGRRAVCGVCRRRARRAGPKGVPAAQAGSQEEADPQQLRAQARARPAHSPPRTARRRRGGAGREVGSEL